MVSTLELECAKFLKELPGGERILLALKEKYRSLGKLGGRIRISDPTSDEVDFLRRIMGSDCSEGEVLQVSVKKFEGAFIGTRFQGVSLTGIIEAYFENAIVAKKAEAEEFEKERISYYNEIAEVICNQVLRAWILDQASDTSSSSYMLLTRMENDDRKELRKNLLCLDMLLERLGNGAGLLPIPVAAAAITSDPHAFDEGTKMDKLITSFLSFVRGTAYPKDAEEKALLLYESGLMKDQGARTVLTYGIEAYTEPGIAKGWCSFYRNLEPLVVTLFNLENVSEIKPIDNNATMVFCFENPSIFIECIKRIGNIAAVCTSGQLNVAGHVVLKKLTDSGNTIYYSGDYDPEGILIADKLRKKYGDCIKFIGFEEELLLKSLSHRSLSEARLKQLERVNSEDLKEIAQSIKSIRFSGYQESVIEELIDSIKKQLESDFKNSNETT